MNDINNNIPNRPRLKKVKRPIRREDTSRVFSQKVYTPEAIDDNKDLHDIDLDALLDGAPEQPQSTDIVPKEELQSQDEFPKFINQIQEEEPQEVLPSFVNKKNIIIALLGSFIVGFFISSTFFNPPEVVKGGLQGVVPNIEVPRGRARCGLTDRTQGCVLYLMNPQRQELNGRDFYDLASQLTARQRFVIETGNMRYSNTKIRPGEIGQFNIPPL